MPSQSPHWTLLKNDLLPKPNYHYFTPFTLNASHGFFAVITESLPVSTQQEMPPPNSSTGAELALEAARLAFADVLTKKCSFKETFLTAFNTHWKAAVLLHVIENKDGNNIFLSSEEFDNDKVTSQKQKQTLALYDPSIAILYQLDQQLLYLHVGSSQIALVNRRYHCDIKKPEYTSLTNVLIEYSNQNISPLHSIDIKADQLEMMALLSHQYANSKTAARLNSNIIKLSRQFRSEDQAEHLIDNSNLIICAKECCKTSPTSRPPLTIKKNKPKKSIMMYAFSLFILTSTASSYYLWQAQATEATSTLLNKPQNQQANQQTDTIKHTTIDPKKGDNTDTKKTILHEEKKQERQYLLAKLKEKEAKEKYQAVALKQQKEQLLREQRARLNAETEAKEQQARIEAKAKITEQKEREAVTQKILVQQEEKQHREKALAQKQNKQQKTFLSKNDDIKRIDRPLQKTQEKKEREKQKQRIQLAKIEAEKKVEQARLNALVKRRRIEFENNKIKEAQRIKIEAEKKIAEQRSAALVKKRRMEFERAQIKKATSLSQEKPIFATTGNRIQRQIKTQRFISDQVAKKKRSMLVELERQKKEQEKAKDEKQQTQQKTAVHQLLGYIKTFSQHTLQLKQKLDKINKIDKNKEASTNHQLIHNRKLLVDKETNIRRRLNSLSALYLTKLKKLCSSAKKYPIVTNRGNKIERFGKTIIAEHLSRCTQVQSLSPKNITSILLDKYLK